MVKILMQCHKRAAQRCNKNIF